MERLLQSIRLGLIVPGSRLPAERELASMLKVSRDTVRDALATLAEAGYVESRRGRYGGTFVAEQLPTERLRAAATAAGPAGATGSGRAADGAGSGASGATSSAADVAATDAERATADAERLAAARKEVEEVAVLRRVLEVGAAREAAGRELSSAERASLSAALEACNGASDTDHRRLDSRLHLIIAECSGSVSLLRAVAQLRTRANALLDQIPMLRPNLAHSSSQHTDIVAAILAGRPDAASEAMLEHVEGSTSLLRGFFAA